MIEYDADAERIARAERELLRLKRAYEVNAPSEHGGCEYLPTPSLFRTEQARARHDAEQVR